MATKVYCEDCVHEEECKKALDLLGVVAYIHGFMDCDSYEQKEETDGNI